MNPRNFFAELKRRNVYKVAVAYAVVGWLVMQVAATVVPALHLSDTITSAVVVLTLLGFPIALILAWAFELTPEGIKRAEDVLPNESITRKTGRKLTAIIVMVAVIAAGLFAFQFLRGKPAATAAAAPNQPPVPAPAAIPEKSIAVLPFENLSSDKENSYFTDGVQDEILSDLAKVADLKVISRTSTVQYKTGVARNLREIGQQLGVAHLLEGSVQRVGNKVRVNAQLIDARTDAHLWAQVYDRPLDDVFAIQSEIAQAIADQLQAKLSPKEEAAMHAQPTKDMVAYDLYLRAKEISQSDSKAEMWQRAVALLDEAVARDPFFVAAYCLLTDAHLDLYWTNHDHTPVRLELATKALDAAARLDPDSGEVHLARAVLSYHGHRDYADALRELALARRSLPNDSTVALITGAIERRKGQLAEATSQMEQAARLDPRNSSVIVELAITYTLGLRHYADGRRVLDQLLLWQPNNSSAAGRRAQIDYLQSGDLRRDRAFLAEPAAKTADPNELARFRFSLAWAERDFATALLALKDYRLPVFASFGFITPREANDGIVLQKLGESAQAQSSLERARELAAATVTARPDDPKALSVLADIDANLGRKEEAIREGERAAELLPIEQDAVDGVLLRTRLALIYAKTGENGRALDLLQKVAKLPFGPAYGDLLDPDWDLLRTDARFQNILASLAPKGDAASAK